MPVLDWIAEQRIKEAIESGELDNVPGMGNLSPWMMIFQEILKLGLLIKF